MNRVEVAEDVVDAPDSSLVDNEAATGVARLAQCILTLISASGFYQVLHGGNWMIPIGLTALVAHVAMWACRRRNTGIGLAVMLSSASVGLCVGAQLLVGSHTTLSVIGASGRRLLDASHGAGPLIDSIFSHWAATVATVAIGIVAIAADIVAFRLRHVLLATIIPLSLFVSSSSLAAGSEPWRYQLGLEATALLFFVWATRAPKVRGGSGLSALGLGFLGVVSTLTFAPAVASWALDHRPAPLWTGTRNGHVAQRVTISPLVDLQTRLISQGKIPVFTVHTSTPSYWRLTSLDNFDGQVWRSLGTYGQVGSNLPDRSNSQRSHRSTTATFHIQSLDSLWLPAPPLPTSVNGVSGISFDPVSSSLISSHATSNGLTYTVVSKSSPGSDLPGVAGLAGADDGPIPGLGHNGLAIDLRLPAMPAAVVSLARDVVRGDRTEYQKAIALQNFFHRRPFVYDLSTASGQDTDALEQFLFVTHRGYCQQYAGAYAVLARVIGLPARIAVGFTAGRLDGPGRYQVLDGDSHSWPEVYFANVGWVPFEPTPGAALPIGQGGPKPTNSPADNSAIPGNHSATTRPATSTVTNSPPTGPQTSYSSHQERTSTRGTGLLYLGLAALGLGLALIVVLVGVRRKRRAWPKGELGPSQSIGPAAAAWRRVVEILARRAVIKDPAETYLEFAMRAQASLDSMGLPGDPEPENLSLVQLAVAVGEEEFGRGSHATESTSAGLRNPSSAGW